MNAKDEGADATGAEATSGNDDAASAVDGAEPIPGVGRRAGLTRLRALRGSRPAAPRATCADAPSAAFIHGLEQFNAREYFECHETLEGIWNEEPGPVRVLYKGILQVGVGCYHLLRGNYRGAMIKLQSGAEYLEPFGPRCMGVEVERLTVDALRLRDAVEAAGPERLGDVDLGLLPIVVWDSSGLESLGGHGGSEAGG